MNIAAWYSKRNLSLYARMLVIEEKSERWVVVGAQSLCFE